MTLEYRVCVCVCVCVCVIQVISKALEVWSLSMVPLSSPTMKEAMEHPTYGILGGRMVGGECEAGVRVAHL